jgi:hypothetical protein
MMAHFRFISRPIRDSNIKADKHAENAPQYRRQILPKIIKAVTTALNFSGF